MAFLESIKNLTSGKTAIERKQSAAANKIIRARSISAAFKEKEKQEIRLAIAKQKEYYNNKIRNLSKKRVGFSSVDIFGQAKQKLLNAKPFKII